MNTLLLDMSLCLAFLDQLVGYAPVKKKELGRLQTYVLNEPSYKFTNHPSTYKRDCVLFPIPRDPITFWEW